MRTLGWISILLILWPAAGETSSADALAVPPGIVQYAAQRVGEHLNAGRYLPEGLVEYYESIRLEVNPEGRPMTVVSGAAGPSIEDVWLMTLFETAYFIEALPVRMDRLLQAWERWTDDPQTGDPFKMLKGFATFVYVGAALEQEMIRNLIRMGLSQRQVTIGLDGENRLMLEIQWFSEYPAIKSKIIFIQHRLEDIRQESLSFLRGEVDVYLQKGAQSAPLYFSQYLPTVSSWIRNDGWMILDRIATTDRSYRTVDPLPLLKGFSIRSTLRMLQAYFAIAKTFHSNGYGRDLTLYQNTHPSPRRAA